MSLSPHGLGESGSLFPASSHLDIGQKKPPSWSSSSTQPPLFPKNESLLPTSDMLPPLLLHSKDEEGFVGGGGGTSKLAGDFLHFDSDSGASSFRAGPSELGEEACQHGSRPLEESFPLGGTFPAVFSSLDVFKPKETELGCFQSQSFGSYMKGSKREGAQKLGQTVAFESDFQQFSSHLQPAAGPNFRGDGTPSPLHGSEKRLLREGLISPTAGICRSTLSRHRSSPASLLSQLAVDAQKIAGSNGEIHTAQISAPFVHSSTISTGALTEYTAETDGGEWDESAMSHGSSFMSMLDDISPRRKEYGDMGGNQGIDGFGLDTEGKASEATTGALTRHLSLPVGYKKQSEPGDNWAQDSVPCRLRAKRGCATHPRSIAERVRRTRISERMRKLQELVPNMEKQTNISDMLDEAIEYVKFLQSEFKKVSQKSSSCRGLCKLDENSKEPN